MNTIKAEIDRLTEAKENIRTSANVKGAEIPGDAKLDEYSSYIDNISTNNSKIIMNDAYYLFYKGRFKECIEQFDFSDCTSFNSACKYCEQIDLTKNNFPVAKDLQYMCQGYKGTSIDLSTFNHDTITTLYATFMSSSIIHLELIGFSRCINLTSLCREATALKTITIKDFTAKINSASELFRDCSSLESVNIINSNMQPFQLAQAFNNCTSLKQIDLSSFDTSKTTNMSLMFNNCTSLTTIENFSCDGLLASPGTTFQNCTSLKTLTFKPNSQIGSPTSSNTIILNLASASELNYNTLINSLGANTSGYVRQIKLNTTLYNSLTAEQIAEAEKKNYTLTYGTS